MEKFIVKGEINMRELDISYVPKISMPFRSDILSFQPERLNPETFEKINCVMRADSSYPHDERLYKRCDSLNS
jgi:hypothetical protein